LDRSNQKNVVRSREQSLRFAESHRIGVITNDKSVPLAYRHPDKSVRDTQLQDECQMDEYCGQ
jgi:hypothetical protein